MTPFLKRYFVGSMRVFAYILGALFWTVISLSFGEKLPAFIPKQLLFIILSALEFAAVGWIIRRTYKPRFPEDLEPGTPDYEYRMFTEKMLYQILLFFVIDIVLAGVSLVYSRPVPGLVMENFVLAIFGAILTIFHLFGLIMLIVGRAAKEKGSFSKAPFIFGIIFLAPGIPYAVYAAWKLFGG